MHVRRFVDKFLTDCRELYNYNLYLNPKKLCDILPQPLHYEIPFAVEHLNTEQVVYRKKFLRKRWLMVVHVFLQANLWWIFCLSFEIRGWLEYVHCGVFQGFSLLIFRRDAGLFEDNQWSDITSVIWQCRNKYVVSFIHSSVVWGFETLWRLTRSSWLIVSEILVPPK